MIPPHDEVAAAEVLAEHGVQQRLARTAVAHLERHPRLDARVLDEVVLDQRVHGPDPDLGRDVPRLELAEDLLDQHAVAHLDGDLGQGLVRAVHGVAELERRHRAPPLVLEEPARLVRSHVEPRVPRRVPALAQHRHRAGQVHLTLLQDIGHAGMRGIGRPEHLLALVGAVDRVLLPHGEHRHQLPGLLVHEGDVLPFPQSPGLLPPGRERDRDRPEGAVGQPELVAHPPPVRLPHEALERGEGADPEHDEIGRLPRGDRESGEAPGPRLGVPQLGADEEPRHEPLVFPVRIHQAHDRVRPGAAQAFRAPGAFPGRPPRVADGRSGWTGSGSRCSAP